MPDNSPNDNLKITWQNQPMEASKMTLETIRQKASESRSKTRRELFGSIVMALIVVAISVFGILHGSNTGIRVVFVLAIVWALAGQILLHRGMWPASLPVEATISTGLEFYQQQIERQQNLVRRVLEWSFGPVILSIGNLIVMLVEIARGRSLRISAVMPFVTLVVIWIIAFFVFRSRDQRKLRSEIDELRHIEKASRQ